ncbi:rod shape-determining protein RodA [Pseudohaliea rubra]|uniref:Peptidoglycan glycosyltransferase MrdB n=1 Tax=Pseudohaliea rubra DSM 19751 TaxID=1265313 RepID=A0A095VMH2_9GAMM|nr:rod shape-determining protein RodA [Pseudohaliea rubra]KGE02560.1 Rod shape-determining protein RodA [Pseudohaliea rubra DSM 19751]
MVDYVRQLPEHDAGLRRGSRTAVRLRLDLPLLLLLLALTAYGLVVLYSAADGDLGAVIRQGRYFVVGYLVLLAAAYFPLVRYQRWSPWGYLGGVLLLVGVMFFGVGAKGAQRWLDLGGFRFQPSEIMKLLVPMTVAWYLADRVLPPRLPDLLACFGLILLPALLILQQPDLGTALLIAASGLFVVFMAGMGWRYIIGALILALASAWPMWAFVLKDYQRQRILTLLNPESDKLGAGWNIIQSKTAIGSGGWSGKGWLDGTQSHLDFLPESHTDFIIAVLGEEFGLRGVVLLLALYLLILLRGFWIGLNAQSTYGRILAGSLTLTFFVYIFVNMGMVSGLLPVVGVPLPLVSAGGTSVVTLLAGFGLLMAVASEQRVIGQ